MSKRFYERVVKKAAKRNEIPTENFEMCNQGHVIGYNCDCSLDVENFKEQAKMNFDSGETIDSFLKKKL